MVRRGKREREREREICMADEGEEGGPIVGLRWRAADNVGEWRSGRVWMCGCVDVWVNVTLLQYFGYSRDVTFFLSLNKARMKDTRRDF